MAKVGPHGLQGLLTLTIHRGQNIKDVQLIGKQDPYCKVHLGKESSRPRFIKMVVLPQYGINHLFLT